MTTMFDDHDDGDVLPWTPLDGGLGPALPLDEQRSALLVSAALDRAQALRAAGGDAQPRPLPLDIVAGASPDASGRGRARSSSRKPNKTFVFWLAAALLVAGVAAAATLVVRAGSSPRQPAHDPRALGLGSSAPGQTGRHGSVESPVLQEPSLAAPLPSTEAPIPAIAPSSEAPSRSSQPPVAVRSAPPADELLRQANTLRAAHRFVEAEAMYQRVVAADAHGNAGTVARISAGTLRLEQLHDPSNALRLFRAALSMRSTGPLAEEARWGIVEAHHALGDANGERQAVQSFLAAHPDSVHGSVAEARLRSLGPATGAGPGTRP